MHAAHVTSDLRVNTQVSCPGKPTLKVEETVTRTGPMTRGILEEAIERRATVVIAEGGRACAFVPDFNLTDQRLSGVAVAYMCATPQGQQGQQGPGD